MTCRRLAILLLLSSPVATLAAPATVTAFEAQVHVAPDPSSPVMYTFAENTRVSVSEDLTNGFRRVRLPDGRVGYVEDGALTVGAAPPAPYAAPPPPPPPPPAYPPPRRRPPPPPGPVYGGPRYADLTARRHLGLHLHLDLGLGYLGSSTSADRTAFSFDSMRGGAGEFSFSIGGAVQENFVVAGEFWSVWAPSPRVSFQGAFVPTGGTFSNALLAIGPSFTWYLMPSNVFVTVTPSLTWLSFSDAFDSFESDVGFGSRFAVGKEWWVGPHWSMGFAGWFAFSVNGEGSGADARWQTFAGGVAFALSLN